MRACGPGAWVGRAGHAEGGRALWHKGKATGAQSRRAYSAKAQDGRALGATVRAPRHWASAPRAQRRGL